MWENNKSIFLFFTDISNKIHEDRIKKLHRYQREIIANMNHNLKTPLNGITLYLEVLRRQTVNHYQ